MQDMMMVRSRLRDIVKKRNIERLQADQRVWSVRSLADAANVAETSVQLLMSGKAKQVHLDTLSKLCATLQCTPGDLLEYTPDEPTDEA